MSHVAILLDHMFEEAEVRVAYHRLQEARHVVDFLGVRPEREVSGLHHTDRIMVERSVADVTEKHYDALVIPGGYSPDRLRVEIDAIRFVHVMALANKTVAAIGHGPSLLIEGDIISGRLATSWWSIRTDLINAGARWVDRDVVVDGDLITARSSAALPEFCDAIIHQLDAGVPERAEPFYVVEPAS